MAAAVLWPDDTEVLWPDDSTAQWPVVPTGVSLFYAVPEAAALYYDVEVET